MPNITFIDSIGKRRQVDTPSGISLMEAAIRGDIAGIEADCGGACSCATCHVYIAPRWQGRMPPRRESEELMLEFALDPRDTSRLSCQILLTDDLDGMEVEVPARQS